MSAAHKTRKNNLFQMVAVTILRFRNPFAHFPPYRNISQGVCDSDFEWGRQPKSSSSISKEHRVSGHRLRLFIRILRPYLFGLFTTHF